MPFLERPDGCRIHYEVRGAGIPVLFLAPGGMTSQIGNWCAPSRVHAARRLQALVGASSLVAYMCHARPAAESRNS